MYVDVTQKTISTECHHLAGEVTVRVRALLSWDRFLTLTDVDTYIVLATEFNARYDHSADRRGCKGHRHYCFLSRCPLNGMNLLERTLDRVPIVESDS